ncbi:MAG: hypothetical protein ACTSPY_06480 [Candidatus Helarchaeota archaeon]
MVIKEKIKVSLFSKLLLTLFIVSFVIPICYGYGTSFSTAEDISPETLMDTIIYPDKNAYYKTYCDEGKSLFVKLSYDSFYDLNLRIYSPSETLVAYSNNTGPSDTCFIVCNTPGYYYIRVSKYVVPGNASYTLKILLLNTIPGFDLVVASFSIITLLGLITIMKIRKSKENLIHF